MRNAEIKLYVLTMNFNAHPDSEPDGHELELRICSGIHAGARLRLEPGRLRLGCGEDAEVVLSDAGLQTHHVVLRIESNGLVTLESHQDNPAAPPQDILPGQIHLAGPVRWSIDTPHAPWPTASDPVVPAHYLQDDPLHTIDAERTESPRPMPPVPDRPSSHPHLPSPPPGDGVQQPREIVTTGRNLWTVIGLTLLLGSLWWLWLRPTATPSADTSPSPQETPHTQASSLVAPAPLVEAVRDAALAGRVQLFPKNDGKDGWEVAAYFLQDDELESLAERLSRLTPRPALKVLGENEVLLAAQETLAELNADTTTKLRLHAVGPGEFQLDGNVSQRQQAIALIEALTQRFPEVVRWHNHTRAPEDHAMALLAELRASGLGQIDGHWSPEGLQLQARLAPHELPRWEELLSQLGRKFGAQVPFKATVNTTAIATPKALPAPFQVQSVVSGDLPYVVLTDGRKLAIGASVQGFRLAEINSDTVRFEGPQTLLLQR